MNKNIFKILIVDDNIQNIKVLKKVLEFEGYTVVAAVSGKQALNVVLQDTIDLILLDVMMPDMDGFEVCQRLKENPSVKAIPIIFITAKTESGDIIKGLQVGALDYITKPFNAPELLARVHNHLELKMSKDIIQKQVESLARSNEQLQELNKELEKALEEIKTLKGLLPVCSNCRKIRRHGENPDEQKAWISLETYIHEHTQAEITHSMCPECIATLYPELKDENE